MATTVEPLVTEQAIQDQAYIRVKAASRSYGLSESELYKAIYSGQLRALKFKTRVWLITRPDLESFIAEHSEPNTA